MAKVFRIFVEKKRGNDIEAGQTLADLRDNVGLNALDDLRIINRYYAQGLTEEEFDLAVKQILSEPNLDNVYTELSIPEDYRYFATEFLPGQYDQRADSAAQCIQLLTAGERPVVQYAKSLQLKATLPMMNLKRLKITSSTLLNQGLHRLKFLNRLTLNHQFLPTLQELTALLK